MPPSEKNCLATASFFDHWAGRLLEAVPVPLEELVASTGHFLLSQLPVEQAGIFQRQSPAGGWATLWDQHAGELSPALLPPADGEELRQTGRLMMAAGEGQRYFFTAAAPLAEDGPVVGVFFPRPASAADQELLEIICRHLFRQKKAIETQTARQLQLTQLEAKARLLEEYARITAHNLRSPLFSMLSMVEMIAEDAREGAIEEEMLGLLNHSAERLNHTLEELDDLIQPEAEHLALKLLVPLPSILDRVMASLQQEFPKVEAELVTDFSAGDEVEGIPSLVESVLYNVMGNALQFRDPERPLRIDLRTNQAPGQLVLQISDNGRGMDLDPNGKLSPAKESPASGAHGLGLRLVKSHMDTISGAFSIESRPGQGTTLRLTFRRQDPGAGGPR